MNEGKKAEHLCYVALRLKFSFALWASSVVLLKLVDLLAVMQHRLGCDSLARWCFDWLLPSAGRFGGILEVCQKKAHRQFQEQDHKGGPTDETNDDDYYYYYYYYYPMSDNNHNSIEEDNNNHSREKKDDRSIEH